MITNKVPVLAVGDNMLSSSRQAGVAFPGRNSEATCLEIVKLCHRCGGGRLIAVSPVTGCDHVRLHAGTNTLSSDITNTLVGISGETGTVARISMFIE